MCCTSDITLGITCRLFYLIICAVVFVRSQQTEGDSCTIDDNNGTCKLISSCPSAVKNLSELGQRPQICGFSGVTPIVCCFDETNTTNANNQGIGTQNTVITTTNKPVNTESINQVIKDHVFIEYNNKNNLLNNTGETTGMKAQQKCLEYSQYIYEWKLPQNETDPNKKVKINNCAHIAATLFIGYETANIREFPHMALLGHKNTKNEREWTCGGILISEEYVLTAAHCVTTLSYGKVRWVRLGEQSIDVALESEIQDFGVEEVIVYPRHIPLHIFHDIALLKLDRKAILNKYVIPACLHVGYEIKEKNVIASGWGSPARGETRRLDLSKRALEIFPYDECNQIYNDTIPHGVQDDVMICEGHRSEDRGTCKGDSGGPVQVYLRTPYCMYDVIGVTSFSKGCNTPGIPGISTRISAYLSWIESIVWPD